jgi:hypothetical protein
MFLCVCLCVHVYVCVYVCVSVCLCMCVYGQKDSETQNKNPLIPGS